MQKQHNDQLNARLESALDAGVALILWSELYRWYETKKIAVNVYRDLNERWLDLKSCNDSKDPNPGELKYIEGSGGIWVFSGKGVRSIKDMTS